MTTVRLILAVLIALITVAGCSTAATDSGSDAAPSSSSASSGGELCTYRAAGSDGEVYAPCHEGEAFAEKMTELGFADYTEYYMPEVATDTCDRMERGQALGSWSTNNLDPEVNRAYREAEVAAKCPEALSG